MASADGIGFVFTRDDPYAGADLDECIGPEGMHPDAAAILLTLDTYSEISPSGTGVKAIVKAGLHGFPRNRTSKTQWGGVFEAYDTKRFFTITANIVRGCPTTVESRQGELDQVLEHVFGKIDPPHPSEVRTVPVDLDDRDLLERAFRARNGETTRMLFAGAWEGRYSSQSEADLALCSTLAFWFGRDPERINRVFRSSVSTGRSGTGTITGRGRSRPRSPQLRRSTHNPVRPRP
jgi:primase-polymerase (primpol)-like protein